MNTLDAANLDCLAALVDEGSFERAAHRLAITQSAVSQRLRTLELQVGQPLVVRARPLRLTAPGQVLLRYARQMHLLRADMARELGEQAEAEDRVPIAVNADSLATWVLPALQPLVDEGVSLELVVDDQDFTHDWLREGRVLGCVSTRADALKGCRVTPLCVMRYVAVASPSFLQLRCGGELHRANFANIPFVVFNRKDDAQSLWVTRAFGVRHPRLVQRYVPSSEAYVRAVVAGWGLGVAAAALVQPALARGDLVPVHPDIAVDVTLYWHQWRLPGESALPQAAPVRSAHLLDRIGAALALGAGMANEAPS